MMRRLKRAVKVFSNKGVFHGIKWIMVTLFRKVIPHKQVIWCTIIDEIDFENFKLPENLSVQRVTSISDLSLGDFKTLKEDTVLMGSAGHIMIGKRFSTGGTLWLLKCEGKLAGYRWYFANDHIHPTYLAYTEKDIHSVGAEILSDFRGKHLAPIFEKEIFRILKGEGLKRCYSETYLWNKQAVKSFLKTDKQKIGIASRFNFFGKNIVIWHDMTEETENLYKY